MLIPPASGHKSESPTAAVQFFDQLEIYPGELRPVSPVILSTHGLIPYSGSKIKHFKELHKKTGIPYSEMVFFPYLQMRPRLNLSL